MNTFFALTGLIVGAAGVGWAIFLLERRLKSRILRWTLSGIVAVLLLTLSWSFLVHRTTVLPAADASMFNERSSYLISIVDAGSPSKTSLFSIEVVVPHAIQINEDAALDLSINGQALALQLAKYETVLKSGKEIQSRTLEPCDRLPKTTNDGSQVLCAKGTLGAPTRWFVRSKMTGTSFVTIQLPQAVKSELVEHRTVWSASLRRNGQVIRIVNRVETANAITVIPVILSLAHPLYHGEEIEIDLRNAEITFPLRFETTLGVSASTYDFLTKFGSILFALLGGGWLWHMLSWLKEKSKGGGLVLI